MTGLTPLLDAAGSPGPPPGGSRTGRRIITCSASGTRSTCSAPASSTPSARSRGCRRPTSPPCSTGCRGGRRLGCGATVDTLGTALMWNLRHFPAQGSRTAVDAFLGGLLVRCRRDSGLWSPSRAADGLLQAVNGYYRAVRGARSRSSGCRCRTRSGSSTRCWRTPPTSGISGPAAHTACNVLDVAHPLWLARRQSAHRAKEVTAWAAGQVDAIIGQWVDGQGFRSPIRR